MVEPNKEQTKVYFSWNDIGNLLNKLLEKINKEGYQFVGVYGLPRGGLPIAVYFSNHLNIPLLKYPEPHCLIVDDIADSGNALKNLIERHSYFIKDNYRIATLHYKQKSVVKPHYSAKKALVKDWIVYPWEDEMD